MLALANLADVEARLDYAMFFVKSLKRISWFAEHPDRSNQLRILLPIKSLEPWIGFLAEASRSYQDSTPFQLQNCGTVENGMELIGRVAI